MRDSPVIVCVSVTLLEVADPVLVIEISVPVESRPSLVSVTCGNLTRLGLDTETALNFNARFAFV